jgi:hypothetical protein
LARLTTYRSRYRDTHRQRVDREQLVAGRAQRHHQQPLRRLDRHRDRLLAAFGVFGQQLEHLTEAGRALRDAPPGHQHTLVVDQRDVVVALRPVDAAPDPHSPPLSAPVTGA